MSKATKLAAGLAVLPALAFSVPVYADSPGDLAQGPDIYQVRNVTTNTGYSNDVAAACGQTVKYSVKLSNTDYSTLTDVTVKASLASGDMAASAKRADGSTTTTSGNVNVTIPANSKLQYIEGTTELFTVDGTSLGKKADGVTGNGINVGNLNGSTRKFLQFQAELNCDTPPTPPKEDKIKVCELKTKNIITIKESEFDSSKHTKDLSKCNATTVTSTTPPTELVKTGPSSMIALFIGVAAAAGLAYNWVLRRQNAR